MTKIQPVYRLYHTDKLGVVDGPALLLDATSDAEALEEAQRASGGHGASLWADDRLIRQFVLDPTSNAQVERRMRSRVAKLRAPLRGAKIP